MEPKSIRTIKVLGHGRAAEARLVEAQLADGQLVHCVEKIFSPGLLTRSIYRLCFQSPFAYQSNQDAILAAFYRRRVVGSLCQALVPEVGVAKPLYTRWDGEAQAFVLACQWIDGRGIVPQPTDRRMVRRWIGKILGDRQCPDDAPPPEEIRELLAVMHQLERMLIDSGLIGTGWQVSPQAIVSTANLLRTRQGYTCVDLESGVPALCVPMYLWAGFRLRSLPLFDDLNAEHLQHWLRIHLHELRLGLTDDQLIQVQNDVELLIHHTQRWKDSEPAILRRRPQLGANRFVELYRQRVVSDWQRRQIVDDPTANSLSASMWPLWLTLVYWLGVIPGKAARAFQRIVANQGYRQKWIQFFHDGAYREQEIQNFLVARSNQLRTEARLPEYRLKGLTRAGLIVHWCLSRILPAKVHRTLTDREYRRDRWIRMGLLCFNPRFQRDYARWAVQRRVEAWQVEQRLAPGEASRLLRPLDDPAIDEYLRGFGMHLGLKLLHPVLLPLEIAVATALVASGELIYLFLLLMALPLLRTAVTAWRIVKTGRPIRDFRDALIIGALPTVGSLAFPIQMYSSFPELSAFLLRDFAARFGRIVPIFGGKDTRTEIACIKSVNAIVEAVEIWLGLTNSQSAGVVERRDSADIATHVVTIESNPWDREAIRQMKLVQQESLAQQSGGQSSNVAKAA